MINYLHDIMVEVKAKAAVAIDATAAFAFSFKSSRTCSDLPKNVCIIHFMSKIYDG